MLAQHFPSRFRMRGFSLVELAVVMTIVAFLLGGLLYTLSAQTEQRNYEETRRRLEQARDMVLGFAIVNGRLPCPARSTSAGLEVRIADLPLVANSGKCQDAGGVVDYYGGTPGGAVGGLLPAATIGYQQVDSAGFAVDAWQNRIRYVVSGVAPTLCSGTSTFPHFTYSTNLKANGITCQPNDLLICKSSTGVTATTCGTVANQIMSTNLVVAIIYSTGKNFATAQDSATATAAGRTDEAANLNGDQIFVFHTPTPSGATNGEFDDQFVWITTGELYGKLIAAGQLP
jgi:prepilin-type N-terminal cleavage/methylation domain-containing protein